MTRHIHPTRVYGMMRYRISTYDRKLKDSRHETTQLDIGAPGLQCTWPLSALEALRNALYKFKTYLLTINQPNRTTGNKKLRPWLSQTGRAHQYHIKDMRSLFTPMCYGSMNQPVSYGRVLSLLFFFCARLQISRRRWHRSV